MNYAFNCFKFFKNTKVKLTRRGGQTIGQNYYYHYQIPNVFWFQIGRLGKAALNLTVATAITLIWSECDSRACSLFSRTQPESTLSITYWSDLHPPCSRSISKLKAIHYLYGRLSWTPNLLGRLFQPSRPSVDWTREWERFILYGVVVFLCYAGQHWANHSTASCPHALCFSNQRDATLSIIRIVPFLPEKLFRPSIVPRRINGLYHLYVWVRD